MNKFSLQKEKAKEKMLEAIFEYAGACHVENIVNEMEDEDELIEKIPYPPELDTQIKKIIVDHHRKEGLKKVAKKLPKAAAIFFVVLISCALLVINVDAFRTRLLNFMIEIRDEYTSIDLRENPSKHSTDNDFFMSVECGDAYLPEFVPEGFSITDVETLTFTKSIRYSNDKNQTILFIQYSGENINLRVDTEDAKVKEILINGIEGISLEKDGYTTLVWHNNETSFYLESQIDKSLLVKMAESMKRKE